MRKIDPGARTGGIERSRARAWPGGVAEDRGGHHWPVDMLQGQSGTPSGAYPASGLARPNRRAPLAGGRRGGMEQGAGTLTYDVRGRWAGAWLRGLFLPRPPSQLGLRRVFSCQSFCTVTALNPSVGASAWEGAPLSRQSPPVRGAWVGAPPRGSPPLLSSRAICAARRRVPSGQARGCRLRLRAERLLRTPP